MGVNLVASRSDREMVMTEGNETRLLNMLKKFGAVADYMTEEMVAHFYGVEKKCMNQLGCRNSEELQEYGYKVYTNAEIKQLQLPYLEKIPNRGLRLYPVKAVIVVGMMLTESQVAEKLRVEITGVKKICKIRKEICFLNQLEETLKPFGISGKRQYKVLNYRIDYYIPSLNIAIEYDENDHKSYSYEKHEYRQRLIEQHTGCKFIRVTDGNSHSYNCGLVLKNIFKFQNIQKGVKHGFQFSCI